MFISLRKKYPDIALIPTADILFAELAHLFRTKEYYEDLDEKLIPENLLILKDGIKELYFECIKGTSDLWETEYHCPYIPSDFILKDWVYWEVRVPDDPFNPPRTPDYLPPPPYIPVIGPLPGKNIPLEISISLTASDLIDDAKWLPALERGLSGMLEDCRNWGLENSNEENIYQRLFFSYCRFLFLVAKYPQESSNLAPPVAIDLMWHAHMTLMHQYINDTQRILGFPLNHHPWKSSKDLLPVSSQFACLWKEEFKTTLENDHIYTISYSKY
jgi:hypothetical protein